MNIHAEEGSYTPFWGKNKIRALHLLVLTVFPFLQQSGMSHRGPHCCTRVFYLCTQETNFTYTHLYIYISLRIVCSCLTIERLIKAYILSLNKFSGCTLK